MEKHRRSNQHRRFKSFLFSPLWTRAVAGFAAIVIFSTTYWLMLPASALTKNAAADVSGLSLEQSGEILVESEETPEDPTQSEQEEPAAITSAENADSVPGPGAGNDGSTPDGSVADSSSGWEQIPEAEQLVITEETTPVAGESATSDGAIADSAAAPSESQTKVTEDANAGKNTEAEVTETSGGTSAETEAGTDAAAESGAEDGVNKEGSVSETESPDTEEETTETEELSSEESEEEDEEEEEVFGSGELLFRGNNYSVTIEYDADAKIPDTAELRVRELEEDSEEYKAHYETAKSNAKENGTQVRTARFFDITIMASEKAEGTDAELVWREIEPAAPVKVNIAFDKEQLELPEKTEVEILHFEDENNAESVEKEKVEVKTAEGGDGTAVSGVGFDAAEFSVFGVVGTQTITTTLLTGDGKTLKVTVNYDEEAQIPGDAKLEVKEITEDDDKWGDRSARLAHVLSEKYGNYYISDARFLSISIMVDGMEFEPKAPVEIVVEYTDPMQTKYTVDTADTDPNGNGEFAGLEEEPQMTSHFAVVHYDNNSPQILEAKVEKTEDLITESIAMTSGFSDYDFVNFDQYDARKAEYESVPDEIRSLKASDIILAAADTPVLRNAGDTPNHSKSLTDNNNGTYTIGLNVEGDADTTSEASDVNVLIVYDVSSSMTIYHAPSETGRYGAPASDFSTSYPELYYRQSGTGNYDRLNNDNYTGTVYTRSGYYGYNEYTGKRYSALWRADVAEKTVYDFVHALFGYQNEDKDNINAAVVTFDASAHSLPRNNLPVTWTTSENDITRHFNSSGTAHNNALYGSGTNWEAALDAADAAVDAITNDNPTYVVFITDGAPTNRNNSSNRDVERCYEAARDEARKVYTSTTESGGEFFGIYAYGEEADWLASLMYYAYNNEEPRSDIRGTTFDTDGYYNAASTAALTEAINEIFQKIVQTLGVTEVSITDGTTSNVATSTGVAHLLVVDNSYQYWLSIPVTAGSGGTYSFTMPDKVTGDNVRYTVTPDAAGENVTISWDGGSASYAGSVNLNTLTVEWTGATSFYNYNPPAASYNSTTGAVEWNLHPIGTLLDGVTYTVTFDCYPSQETLDLITDLKNGDIKYSEVDPAIQQYLSSDYDLMTNTTATLSYTDTRPGGGSGSIDYVNPDPQPVNATELVTVSKIWNNSLDSREGWEQDLELYVTRDDVEVHTVKLTRENNWTGNAWISYGILTEDENGGIHLKTTGHDYSFSEDIETGYYWEIKAPTIRPMLIGTEVTMLKLVENPSEDITGALGTDANAKAEVGDNTYYKLTIDGEAEYYVVVNDVSSALTATNHRRSYLDVVKTVTGGNVPEDDEFTFTMTVCNANDETADPEDINSDSWVWFSIRDTVNNARVTDPDAATATGLRWQLNDETVVTTKPAVENFNGYFCVPSETDITVKMKNGYSLRFLNLPEGTGYTIAESAVMPADNYSFTSIAGTRSYDADQNPETTGDWTTVSTGTASGQSITGTIEYVESAYKVTVTNKWNTIDVKLKKVDENGTVLDGATFTLTSGDTTIGTYSPDSTSEDGNPIDLGGLGIGIYKLEETGVPAYYSKADDMYLQVYKDTGGSLKAQLVDSDGNVLSDQSPLSSETGPDGLIYTITVQDIRKTASVKVLKNVIGLEIDKSNEFEFSISGVEKDPVSHKLVGDPTADNHFVIYNNIPYGTSITVTEAEDSSSSFTTTYSVNGDEATTGRTVTFTVNDSTVNSEGVAEVIFTNRRNKQLIRVFKYETGTTPEKPLSGAEFSITGPEGTEIAYTGSTVSDGYLVCDGTSKKLIELPVNSDSYLLSETKAPDGYYIIDGDVNFTVTETGVIGAGDPETITDGDVTVVVYTIKIQNSAGVALPSTGGPGTRIFTILGGMLIALAGALLLRKRRFL